MITKLENRFEDLKEKFSKEEIVLIFAKFECENLLEQTTLSLKLLKNIDKNDPLKHRFTSLHKQVVEFDEFLADLIEEKHHII